MISRTTPFDIEHVAGYPDTLQIYRIGASKFWQMRMFVDRKHVRKSTRETDKKLAIDKAKELFVTIRANQRMDINVHTDTFYACAERLMKRQESLVASGQRDDRILSEDRKKLSSDIVPFFGTKGVATIRTSDLDDYLAHIGKRKLTPSTLQKHIVVIRKVLNEAVRLGFMNAIPPMPRVPREDNPRPWFTKKETVKLIRTSKSLAAQNLKVRGVPLDDEIWCFLGIALNSFVRPSDWKELKNRHVEIVKGDPSYLSMLPASSKTVTRESISMPVAAQTYRNLLGLHEAQGMAGPEDYVFFPQYKNRAYALQTMRRQFEFILEQAELRKDKLGQNRTLYSLRHTALMLRFLDGDNIDIFFLAKNALTSVDQLERFYLSHVYSRAKIKNLHSKRQL